METNKITKRLDLNDQVQSFCYFYIFDTFPRLVLLNKLICVRITIQLNGQQAFFRAPTILRMIFLQFKSFKQQQQQQQKVWKKTLWLIIRHTQSAAHETRQPIICVFAFPLSLFYFL